MVITANIKILFIAVCHYQLLIVFVLFSILLWYLTFAVISSFVQFPAESWDLYGTFVAMVTNPVSSYMIIHLANILSYLILCCIDHIETIRMEVLSKNGLSITLTDCECNISIGIITRK